MAGYDTANEIQNVYAAARSEFTATPRFWIRYFSPSPAADLFSSDAKAEAVAAWASGGRYVGCVSAPAQSNLSSTAAQGQADAQSMCASLLTAYHAVSQLRLPAGRELWCWLDQEASTSLSHTYWNGWSNYIAHYNFAGLGRHPLYPGLYCNPHSGLPSCSTIAQATGPSVPVAVWSSEPEPCGGIKKPPPWNAQTCASVSSSRVTSKLWQYGEQIGCGFAANVDINYAATGWDYRNHCFRISSLP